MSDVCEGAVAVVYPQLIGPDMGCIEIGKPVTIVVTGGYALPESRSTEAGLGRSVGKSLAQQVLKQPVAIGILSVVWRPGPTLREKDVGKTVEIIVEDSDPASGKLEHPPRRVAFGTVEIPEPQAHRSGIVLKRHWVRRPDSGSDRPTW